MAPKQNLSKNHYAEVRFRIASKNIKIVNFFWAKLESISSIDEITKQSINQQKNKRNKSTWKSESCSFVKFVVKARTTTALLSSCNFWTEASALFLPTSSSEKMKLLDKSHNSTIPSSCKVTDLTPARMRFFAAANQQKRNIEHTSKNEVHRTNNRITTLARVRIKSQLHGQGKNEVKDISLK